MHHKLLNTRICKPQICTLIQITICKICNSSTEICKTEYAEIFKTEHAEICSLYSKNMQYMLKYAERKICKYVPIKICKTYAKHMQNICKICSGPISMSPLHIYAKFAAKIFSMYKHAKYVSTQGI